MPSITQYILNRGIPEDIFILILAIPIIFVVINFGRRIIGLRTFGLYTPVALILLLYILDIEYGAALFALVFVPMAIIRYFMKKIAFLSMTDTRVLDTLVFCCLIIVFILAFTQIPFFKNSLNFITLLAIIVISWYSEGLITVWEVRGFKRFIFPALESLSLITVSYFLISWSFMQIAILGYPFVTTLVSVILITLLSQWRGLKVREYIEFKEAIKHAELSKKK